MAIGDESDLSIGLPPGTLVAHERTVVPDHIHVIHYTPDAWEEADYASVEEVLPYRERDGVTWLNIDGLGNVELVRKIGEAFGLHPLALEDSLHTRQRPKVDDYESAVYVAMRMLHYEHQLESEQVSLFLGTNFVITFQEHPGDCFETVRQRIRKSTGLVRRNGADYLMYALLDAIVDNYFPFLESLGERVEELEIEVVSSPSQQTLGHVREIKRDMLTVRRCVWPLRDAINAMIRDDNPLIGRNTRVYLRDCYDHTVHLLDIVETYRELAAGLMDVYLSSLSNKMNEIMKVLTIIATIFIPLTFLAGVYGMNFHYMPELEWQYGYALTWGVMITVAGIMLLVFRRMGWLGRTRK